MKRIAIIREALDSIPGSFMARDPDVSGRGPEPGVHASTVWNAEDDRLWNIGSPALAEQAKDLEEDVENHEHSGAPECEPVFEFGAEVDETLPAFGPDKRERIRKSVMLFGMDALGWYVSFHVRHAQWGVHIPLSSLAFMTIEVFRDLPASLNTKFHLAFHAILNHELFHFAADYMTAQWELIQRAPLWVPSRQANEQSPNARLVAEEKLANAYMLDTFRTGKPALRVRGKLEALRKFTKLQPPGYCDGWKVKRAEWDKELAILTWQYLRPSPIGQSGVLWDDPHAFDFMPLFPIRPRIDWRYCPIHVIRDGYVFGIPRLWLDLFTRIEMIEETEPFRRMLSELALPVRKSWEKTKRILSAAITPGCDLKKWPKLGDNVFSVRVNDNFRAHLRRPPDGGFAWQALAIGSHKKMGHG